MQIPGFVAEASLNINEKKYGWKAMRSNFDPARVLPQGCDVLTAIRCSASVAACVAACAAGPAACIACFAGIGASDCLKCVQ
jgi:hypothetical protein